jgi:hypothetical protein
MGWVPVRRGTICSNRWAPGGSRALSARDGNFTTINGDFDGQVHPPAAKCKREPVEGRAKAMRRATMGLERFHQYRFVFESPGRSCWTTFGRSHDLRPTN